MIDGATSPGMWFILDDPEVEALARGLLRETIERSGWYPDVRPQARAERIEHDVEQLWRMMAQAARKRLEQDRT